MEETKTRSQKADLAALITAAAFTVISVFAVNRIACRADLSQGELRTLVIGFDCFLILFSGMIGKISGLTLRDFGLFPKQCLLLLSVPLVGTLMHLWKPEAHSLFSLPVTFLGAFSEEVCFRGMLLALTMRVSHSKTFSILSQALLFGLIHYFSYGDLLLCLSPFACGLLFCALRVVLPKSIGLPILILLHWINNFFLN